jgi:hypothetical protein
MAQKKGITIPQEAVDEFQQAFEQGQQNAANTDSADEATGSPEDMVDEEAFNVTGRAPVDIPQDPINLRMSLPTGVYPGAHPKISMSQKYMETLQSPEYQEQLKQLTEAGRSALEGQRRGLQENEESYKKFQEMPQQVDFSPLAALSDSWTGSNLLPAAKQVMSPENRMKLQQELQAKLQEQRKGLSQEEIAFLKSQLEAKTQPLKELQSMTKLDSEGNRTDRQMYRLDKNEHLNVLKSLDNDKQNVARATAVSNLANAVNNFTAAKIQGPQQLNELQQAVRSNIGIARQSGVGERELTYINSLDQLLTNSEQFWKNKPQSLQSKEIAKHIIELATLEQDNLTAQAQERMSALMTGHETMYDEHPEWREDLDRKAQAILKTYAPSSKGKEYINAPSKKKTAVVKVNSPEPDYSKMSDDELSQIYNAKFGGGQ